MPPPRLRCLPTTTRSVGLFVTEHKRAQREQRGADGEHEGEHEGATREHIDETGVSGGAKRRDLNQQSVTCCPQVGAYTYNYIFAQIGGALGIPSYIEDPLPHDVAPWMP